MARQRWSSLIPALQPEQGFGQWKELRTQGALAALVAPVDCRGGPGPGARGQHLLSLDPPPPCWIQCHLYEIGLTYRRQIIWHYENGFSGYTKTLAAHYEPLLWFSNGEGYTYHPIREPYRSTEQLKHKITKNGKQWTPNPPEGRMAGDVWRFPTLAGRRFRDEKVDHPTQKPLSISQRIVAHFSNPGDLVLVPFAGSGSECLAAAITGVTSWASSSTRSTSASPRSASASGAGGPMGSAWLLERALIGRFGRGSRPPAATLASAPPRWSVHDPSVAQAAIQVGRPAHRASPGCRGAAGRLLEQAKAPPRQSTTSTAAAVARTPKFAKVVFIDKQNACDCTKKRIDGAWAALQGALGKPTSLRVERIHVDTEAAKAEAYTMLKPLVVPPGVYFVDQRDSVVETLQGEITTEQNRGGAETVAKPGCDRA